MLHLIVILPVLLLFLLIIPLYVNLNFKKDQSIKLSKIEITLFWGIVKVPITLPSGSHKGQKSNKYIYKTLLHSKFLPQFMYALGNRLLKFGTLHKLHLHIKYGGGDAFYTGIIGGTAWTLLGNLLFLTKKMTKSSYYTEKIIMTPNYQELTIQGETQCQMSFRPYHLMIAIIWGGIYTLQRRLLY